MYSDLFSTDVDGFIIEIEITLFVF